MGSTTPHSATMSLPASLSLSNRTALITGGTRGIGKGISLELGRRGVNIAIVYANPKNANMALETLAEIETLKAGVKTVAILADLKDAQVYAGL
jgi:3-oxoacyl-[acyl-carrier protein] reductase